MFRTTRDRVKSVPTAVWKNCKKYPGRWAAGAGITSAGAAVLIWFFFFAVVSIAGQYSRLSQELVERHPEVDSRDVGRAPKQVAYAEPAQTGNVELTTTPKSRDAIPVYRLGSYMAWLNPDSTTVDLDVVLKKYDLSINGGFREAGIVIVQTNQEREYDAVDPLNDELLRKLRAEDVFLEVGLDPAAGTNAIPRHTGAFGHDPLGEKFNWDWRKNERDGNWGQKLTRLPTVWTILDRAVERGRSLEPVTVSIIDAGFREHEDLAFFGNSAHVDGLTDCVGGSRHGNHVAGIVGAIHGNGKGTNGVAPNIRLAVDTARATAREGTTNFEILVQAFAADIITGLRNRALADPTPSVINISMGYNWKAKSELPGLSNEFWEIAFISEKLTRHILAFLEEGEKFDRTLIVTAAGNDSREGAVENAKLGSAINRGALAPHEGESPASNVLVVEATDRDDQRWVRSNTGGHISAPGVNILSASAPSEISYSVCSGTSMAAPLVSGIAAILFAFQSDADRDKVKEILIASASPGTDGSAPRVDALEAILAIDENALTYLADLNVDGLVDRSDLDIFIDHYRKIADSKPFQDDLNDDGEIDAFEDQWPIIDLNGSGVASNADEDRRPIKGDMLRDIDVLKLAWTADIEDFPPDQELDVLISD